MLLSQSSRKAIWLVPIVIAICAVMVLPGGTFLASGAQGGNPMAAAAGLTTAVAPSANSFHTGAPAAPATGPASLLTASPSTASVAPSFGTSTSTAGHVASLPSYLDNTPWAQALVHPTTKIHPTLSVPNLNLLTHPATAVNGLVNPGYTAQPAPLGVADYGLGVTPYSYNSSHMMGQVMFTAPPNVTQPGAYGVVLPTAQGEKLGYVGSLYEFGVQLNTIGVNISIPGTSDQGYIWAQNVVNWNDSGIHFVQDTWNFSLDSYGGWNLDSIYSGCGTDQAGVNYILEVYGGVLQCSEANVPISAADYPVTLSVYNNITTNAQHQTVLVYGYSVYEAGSGTHLSGVADTVVFGAPSSTAPPNKPGNTVNPFEPTPTFGAGDGFPQDSEMDIVGGIGGDNAMFRAINGTVNLEYSNASSGGWKNAPSAYNFGSDTGETSAGFSGVWTPSHTLDINQGPTMLYGLWNAQPQVAVHSGSLHVAGTISPSYGFVFVSNTAPVLNPWTGGQMDNMSWLPTTNTGAFDTYLPPLGAPWTTTYHVQAFAAGSTEYNGTISGPTTSLAIALSAASGTVRAPLYMYTAAQASTLAAAVGGSSSSPYTFSGLTVNANFTFNHVNDYEFPEFEIFMSQGVNDVVVNDTYQGTDSGPSGNSYIIDYGGGGILVGPPYVYIDYPGYTSNINIWGGTDDQVLNQELETVGMGSGSDGYGVTLWQDTNAYVNNTWSFYSSWGVWIGQSVGTEFDHSGVEFGGWGLSEIGNTGTHVFDFSSFVLSKGIETYATADATYSFINVTLGSLGFSTGIDFGLGPTYDIAGTSGLTVNDLNVTAASVGANVSFSDPTTFNTVQVWDPTYDESLAIELDNDVGVTVNGLVANYSAGIYSWNTTGLTVNDAQILNFPGIDVYLGDFYVFAGIEEWYDTNTVVNSAYVYDSWGGLGSEYPDGFTATDLSSAYSIFSYEIDYSLGPVTVTGISSIYDNIGFNYDWSSGGRFSDVSIDEMDCTFASDCAGINFLDSSDGSVTGVTATNGSLGAQMFYEFSGSPDNTVTNVVADSDSTGVVILDTHGDSVSQVTASDDSLGVQVDPSSHVTVSTVTVSSDSLGVEFDGSTWSSATGITVSDFSLGVVAEDGAQYVSFSSVSVTGDSIGVIVAESSLVTISGVTATNATLDTPWTYEGVWGAPTAAVDLFDTEAVTVTGVTATTYPTALYDDESESITVGNLNATGGWYGIVLNGTDNSLFTGISAYQDFYGIVIYPAYYTAEDNTITQSSFVDDTSYGVAILGGEYDLIYDNTFIGNNGATGTYDPAHVQAYSVYYDDYSICTNELCTTGIGNYWSDWHTYGSNGYLAPFPVSGGSIDYFPLGPQETFSVSFTETGLPSGTTWSVTFDGMTLTGGTTSLNFTVPMGTYSYQVGDVAGYTVSPSSGTVTVAGTTYNVPIGYSADVYAVTLSEGGLSAGTSWGATVNGQSQSTTGTSLTFYLPAGSYSYSFSAVSGYNLPSTGASGTVDVTNAPVSLATTYSPTSSPSYVKTSDFNNWLAVALAVAVIALVIGLLALLLRRRKEPPTTQGAQAWTPPPTAGTPPASGGSAGWSEGPSSGGPPPS
ncbi:MAG TPA: thermopsin family protease [Thermoplasmata archaeon]|nr:thermopsin family protease [Thermoplasmata archaeon]